MKIHETCVRIPCFGFAFGNDDFKGMFLNLYFKENREGALNFIQTNSG